MFRFRPLLGSLVALTLIGGASAQVLSVDVNGDANMVAGRTYLERGKYRSSVKAYELALGNDQTLHNQGVAHGNVCIAYMRLKIWKKAMEHCDAAVGMDPGNWSYRNNRATLMFFMGRLNEAKAQYEESLALAPNEEILQRNVKLVNDILRRGRGPAPRAGERGGTPLL